MILWRRCREHAADRLYELLPAIHRIRDAEQGYPLRELLAVIAEQVAAMEENLEQLYDDQFIETCAPWVAPYIGDLIGYRTLHGVVPNVASPRADVANTIRYRRRKGTASMLEQLARDVTGWPARAVEFFQLLGWTQNMNHLRTSAHYAPDLRNWETLQQRDTAFDTIAHTVDVRRISTGAPRHNIANIGLYLWRVRALPLTRSPAVADLSIGGGLRFRFNPLGVDMALYNTPETEVEISHLAEPRNVPMPLARRWLKAHLDDYYGLGKSLWLELDGNPPQLIARNNIRICDLSDIKDGGGNVIAWAHQPAAGSGRVAIDPVLGRIAFADAPASTPLVNFHYGHTIAIGGGEYERGDPAVPITPVQTVHGGAALQPALNTVQNGGTVEVLDSRRYVETLSITVNAGKTVVLRAVNGARPLLVAGGDIALTLGAEVHADPRWLGDQRRHVDDGRLRRYATPLSRAARLHAGARVVKGDGAAPTPPACWLVMPSPRWNWNAASPHRYTSRPMPKSRCASASWMQARKISSPCAAPAPTRSHPAARSRWRAAPSSARFTPSN